MLDKNINMIDFQTVFVSFVILGVSLLRLIPHVHNFSPILALAIFGAFHFRNNVLTYVVPLLSLWFSDLIINNYIYNFSKNIVWFYEGFYWQYVTYLIIIFTCLKLNYFKSKFNKILFLIISSSLLFFLLSNFGYWLTSDLYPHNALGLVECYIAAIPFYKGTLYGTLFYTPLFFGLYFVLQKRISFLKINYFIYK